MNEEGVIDNIVFLGAGASKAEGAPIQADLFKKYFQVCKPADLGAMNSRQNDLYDSMITFFKDFFGIDINNDDLDNLSFPSFEEVLGVLEFAGKREECFKGWGSDSGPNIEIQQYKQNLIFLIGTILEQSLHGKSEYHGKLIQRLKREGTLAKTAFVSVNYEILIDNSLELSHGGLINYGVSIPRYDAVRENHLNNLRGRSVSSEAVYLLKLHGSLNWLYCPTCISLEVTPLEKSASRLVREPRCCERCHTQIAPIIVPPTFFKVMTNHFLEQIWHQTDVLLRSVKKIFFCGYSFPDADIHIKYLLKRAELYNSNKLEIYVINKPGEGSAESRNEAERYRRFFKNKDAIHYLDGAFQQFCESGISGMSEWKFVERKTR